jgi:hypothetical protein
MYWRELKGEKIRALEGNEGREDSCSGGCSIVRKFMHWREMKGEKIRALEGNEG